MAHALDRMVFTALTVIFAFALARNLTGSLPLAMLIAAVAPYPAHLLLRLLQRQYRSSGFCLRRKRRKLAAQTVRFWGLMRDASCRSDVLALLRAAYPDVASRLQYADEAEPESVPVHLFLTLKPVNEDAVADRMCRLRTDGTERAVLVATSEFSDEARSLAMLPGMPTVAMIDSTMLTALLVRHPKAVRFRSMPEIRPHRPKLSRAHALRMIPVALLLLGMYLVFGLPLYLPAGLALTWCILMLLKKRPISGHLFP